MEVSVTINVLPSNEKAVPEKGMRVAQHLIGGCGQLGVQLHLQRVQEQEEKEKEEKEEEEEEEVELEQVQEIAKVQAKQIKSTAAAVPQNQS